MHVQNFFPLISPSVYFAAKARGVPVVQSIRNYRLFCLNGLFYTKGEVCERCFGKLFASPGVKRACYRQSRIGSLAVAMMLFVHHHITHAWTRKVDRFIALSEFVAAKLSDAGIPKDRIRVKPNFVNPDPGVCPTKRKQFVYAGRLSKEKGPDSLLAAWRLLADRNSLGEHSLMIAGDGPEKARLEAISEDLPVKFAGHTNYPDLLELIGQSVALVFPSECYETFGRAAVEAYAKGVPVIASRIGAVEELVQEGETGFLFDPGNTSELADILERFIREPELSPKMSASARDRFENRYSADINAAIIETVYAELTCR